MRRQGGGRHASLPSHVATAINQPVRFILTERSKQVDPLAKSRRRLRRRLAAFVNRRETEPCRSRRDRRPVFGSRRRFATKSPVVVVARRRTLRSVSKRRRLRVQGPSRNCFNRKSIQYQLFDTATMRGTVLYACRALATPTGTDCKTTVLLTFQK